jgi:leucyl aminopeptidase
MTELTTSDEAAAQAAVDVLVIAVAKGEDGPQPLAGSEAVDGALSGRLAAILTDLGFTGDEGEVARFPSLGALVAPVIAAVGVGSLDGDGSSAAPSAAAPSAAAPSAEVLRKAGGAAARSLAGRGSIGLAFPPGSDAAAEGALLAAYAVKEPAPGKAPVGRIVQLSASGAGDAAGSAARASVLARSVKLARDLGNLPANLLPPAAFADRARAEAEDTAITVTVLDETELKAQGFGGIIGVGQGSVNPPRLVQLAYTPKAASTGARRHVALVGKGITFDSGGLSLKPSVGMEYMKIDMAGAAAVLGAVLAAARLELPIAVTGWLAAAENMPSAAATRPTDVLTMYGGKRVEVLNTDAEGRLVLADTLARASEDAPDVMVDVATLTGGQVIALGSRTTGLMGNDEALLAQLTAVGKAAGEPMWAMPMPPEIRKSLDSEVADLSNVARGGNRDGHMLVGGIFLNEFVGEGIRWAHLDIAGPAWNGGEPYGFTPRGATGVMVRTLVGLLEELAGQS